MPVAPIRTERLKLVPLALDVARAATTDRTRAAFLLQATIPDEWPAADLRDFLPFYVEELAANPAALGWGIWLVVDAAANAVIGDAGFKGAPDTSGAVEIGYSIVAAERNRGYAAEAARALVAWVFGQPDVRRVIAECLADNAPSIAVLHKLGLHQTATADGMITWELAKSDTAYSS